MADELARLQHIQELESAQVELEESLQLHSQACVSPFATKNLFEKQLKIQVWALAEDERAMMMRDREEHARLQQLRASIAAAKVVKHASEPYLTPVLPRKAAKHEAALRRSEIEDEIEVFDFSTKKCSENNEMYETGHRPHPC